jgi:hypothetical protein
MSTFAAMSLSTTRNAFEGQPSQPSFGVASTSRLNPAASSAAGYAAATMRRGHVPSTRPLGKAMRRWMKDGEGECADRHPESEGDRVVREAGCAEEPREADRDHQPPVALSGRRAQPYKPGSDERPTEQQAEDARADARPSRGCS